MDFNQECVIMDRTTFERRMEYFLYRNNIQTKNINLVLTNLQKIAQRVFRLILETMIYILHFSNEKI